MMIGMIHAPLNHRIQPLAEKSESDYEAALDLPDGPEMNGH